MTISDELPFDPLAVENIGITLAVELLEQPIHQLPPAIRFPGAGIYALYYLGPNPAYRDLVKLDDGRAKFPVYIGKSVRESAKDGFSPRPTTQAKLFQRLKKHEASIEAATNLDASDFRCRYLVLNDAFISLAESVAIRVFRPPWNGMGVGSNSVGVPRMSGKPSLWDSLHPGRAGRPPGVEDQALLAAQKIADCIAQLSSGSTDPLIQKMYNRIMKFV